jgi:hypothetical protein
MAIGGFILMGATPSFIDWEQEPEKHVQIVVFYGVAISLFYFGLLQ